MPKLKELSTVESKVPANFDEHEDIFEFLPRAETTDFDIPRLTLIQPTSKIEGSPGDVIDSVNGTKICGLNQKLVFAPVWFLKDFAVTEVDSKKFRRNEPKSMNNAHFAAFNNRIATDSDGVSVERKERLNIFLIQDSSLIEELPRVYRMILKPSSFKEAKKFLSEWDIQIRTRQNPTQFLWSVTPKQITNEKGKFVILEFAKEVKDGKQLRVSAEQGQKINFWVKTLMKNQDQVLKSSIDDEESSPRRVEHQEPIPF